MERRSQNLNLFCNNCQCFFSDRYEHLKHDIVKINFKLEEIQEVKKKLVENIEAIEDYVKSSDQDFDEKKNLINQNYKKIIDSLELKRANALKSIEEILKEKQEKIDEKEEFEKSLQEIVKLESDLQVYSGGKAYSSQHELNFALIQRLEEDLSQYFHEKIQPDKLESKELDLLQNLKNEIDLKINFTHLSQKYEEPGTSSQSVSEHEKTEPEEEEKFSIENNGITIEEESPSSQNCGSFTITIPSLERNQFIKIADNCKKLETFPLKLSSSKELQIPDLFSSAFFTERSSESFLIIGGGTVRDKPSNLSFKIKMNTDLTDSAQDNSRRDREHATEKLVMLHKKLRHSMLCIAPQPDSIQKHNSIKESKSLENMGFVHPYSSIEKGNSMHELIPPAYVNDSVCCVSVGGQAPPSNNQIDDCELVFFNSHHAPQWQAAPALNVARYSATLVYYEQFLFVFGGACEDGYVSEIERSSFQNWNSKSPQLSQWEEFDCENMNDQIMKVGMGAIPIKEQGILLFGGNGKGNSSQVLYDVNENKIIKEDQFLNDTFSSGMIFERDLKFYCLGKKYLHLFDSEKWEEGNDDCWKAWNLETKKIIS